MNVVYDPVVRMIPIKQITVLNPRERGKHKFAQITENIAKLGLKKPITVAHLSGKNGDATYSLVCGQGRMEAYVARGETTIPAIVVKGSPEELLLMSMAENLARRQHTTIELVREIRELKGRGYNHSEIARKIDLQVEYVRGILLLLEKGEDRLIQAVESGHLPVGIATVIATADDKAVQKALQDAYEKNNLRGKKLLRARRLIDQRKIKGKKPRAGARPAKDNPVSGSSLLKAFQDETLRQKMIVQKAKISENRLLFVVNAIRDLFKDENFVTLLRAEALDTLPDYLAHQIYGEYTP